MNCEWLLVVNKGQSQERQHQFHADLPEEAEKMAQGFIDQEAEERRQALSFFADLEAPAPATLYREFRRWK